MAETRKNGEFLETSYFENIGGLNISDSPFRVKDTQATGGANFEYTQTGGIQKRRGPQVVNTTADTELYCHGIDVYNTTLGTKTVIRAAERKIQSVVLDSETFTDLTQDTTAAGSDVFPADTITPTSFAQFNTDTISLLNFCGSTDAVYSVYSPTKYTKNGSVAPSGTFTATTIAGGGAWAVTGTYKYAVSYTKRATSAESNAYGSVSVSVAAVTNSVVLTFSSLTSVDTTTYSMLNLYRSAVGGATDFTTGDLVASLTLPVTSYTDTGGASLLTQNVPRADSVVLDNSTLPTGTYNVLTLWKRRLVTATGSVLRFSELNEPEAWPTVNTITIPSGGPITGLAVISFNTDYGNDEYLAVFKERELWLVRGDDYTDITLSFIDTVGCANQALIALANGFLTWVDYRGIYLWDGSGKPIYTSRPIEPYFSIDGDLNKPLLQYGVASYFRNRNMVYWFLSSKQYGEQALTIKMDLRLTLPGVESTLSGRVLDGTFVIDTDATVPVYAAKAYLPDASADEIMVVGDASGYVYKAYQTFSDNGTGIDFNYYTPFLDLGSPNQDKRFHKVVAWVDAVGDWDLVLDYWAGYRAVLTQRSTISGSITPAAGDATALWDVGFWDEAYWDDYTSALTPIVFNLNNMQGNSEGDCIRLKFRNDGVDEPVTIYGYSVFWTEKGLRR
jgi:hypothetical protein